MTPLETYFCLMACFLGGYLLRLATDIMKGVFDMDKWLTPEELEELIDELDEAY